jgi:hypothetical protein
MFFDVDAVLNQDNYNKAFSKKTKSLVALGRKTFRG